MPYANWPLHGGCDGCDWSVDSKKEVFTVEESGLSNLDYLFGAKFPDYKGWKESVFALHSRCRTIRVVFSYEIKKNQLTVETRQEVVKRRRRQKQ